MTSRASLRALKKEHYSQRLADHGRHIFAYNQIWTGQTIYSFERTLNNTDALKQLTFAGKKTLPSALRKDLWRPLLAVSFPSPSQGLHAFRKLREYRKLHELAWTTPKPEHNNGLLDLDNPYVRHSTQRPSKKERSRAIMDQRANSIADLALVLREQAELGAATEQGDIDRKAADESRIREEMVQLAEEERNGGIPVLQAAINAQSAAIKELGARRTAGGDQAPTKKHLRRENLALNALRLKMRKMKAVKEAIEDGHAKVMRRAESASKSGNLQHGESVLELSIDPPQLFYPRASADNVGTIPKRGDLRKAVTKKQVPNWAAEGVIVRWTNPLDAEYAESWPAAVEHQDAGIMKHTWRKIEDTAVFEVEQVNRSPKALAELEMDEAEDWAELDEPAENEQEARQGGDFIQLGKAGDAKTVGARQ